MADDLIARLREHIAFAKRYKVTRTYQRAVDLMAECLAALEAGVSRPRQECELDYVQILKMAKTNVNGSVLYKRFIDGTPLENDIAVWMADFALEIVRMSVALLPSASSGAPPPWQTDIFPIPLNDEQVRAAKDWAADDRLWTTQETVEFNLRTFARKILSAVLPSPPASASP